MKKQWSYLDHTGATAFEMQCKEASEFSEGLAAILVGQRTGFIDTKGDVVIAPQFAQGCFFHEGMAAVEVFNAGKGKTDYSRPQQFGYIDREGNLVIPATFRFATDFSEGLAGVRITDAEEVAFIDQKGEIAIPPIACEAAGRFKDGLAPIQGADDEFGYINRRGEFVWPLRR